MVLWGQISVDKTKLEQIITLPNFTFGQLSCELGQIMTGYDFLWLDEWFWAMFEPTWIWPN